jgi:hypothetical protein
MSTLYECARRFLANPQVVQCPFQKECASALGIYLKTLNSQVWEPVPLVLRTRVRLLPPPHSEVLRASEVR